MSDQRIAERVQLSYYLKVYERGSQKLLGQILDITQQGLNLLSSEPIGAGLKKSFLVDLPDPIMRKRRLSLHAESRWCKRDINPSYYSIGFKFEESSDKDTAIISSLMRDYEFGLDLQHAF